MALRGSLMLKVLPETTTLSPLNIVRVREMLAGRGISIYRYIFRLVVDALHAKGYG